MNEAVGCCQEALRLRPHFPEALNNLGNALQDQGQLDEAVACYRQALALRPDFSMAHYNLGATLRDQGRRDDAVACFRQALTVRPDYPEALNSLGAVLQDQGRLNEAIGCYKEALRLRPHFPEAFTNLGNLHSEQNRSEEAVACYRQALRLRPDYPEALNNLGAVLREQGQLSEAADCCREALRLRPHFPEALNNLGNALQDQGRLDEAVACYRQAVQLNAGYAEAFINWGNALKLQGRFDEALARYDDAVRLAPDNAQSHNNRSLLWLLLGDFARGWPEQEWRWRTKAFSWYTSSKPRWDGSDLDGRTILLFAEQGLGDTLQFIRYAPLVKMRGGRVVVECQPLLQPLLSRCPGIDQLLTQGSPRPDYDVEAPLLSLPSILGTTLDAIPALVPYLAVDPSLVSRWRSELREGRFKVGVVWQGNRGHSGDRWRSAPLAQFASLAEAPGVQLYSLQKGPGAEQAAGAGFPIIDLGNRLEHFADAAAVMMSLDLVVTVDTAAAHCAGALGVPVWVALPFAPDWRWLLDREDSPWYPTMRLFRQKQFGQWPEVFARIAAEIGTRAS